MSWFVSVAESLNVMESGAVWFQRDEQLALRFGKVKVDEEASQRCSGNALGVVLGHPRAVT